MYNRFTSVSKRVVFLTTFTACVSFKPVKNRLETSIFDSFVQNPGQRQIKELDGFVQRLLIHPPEHRATKKPLLAG